MKYKEIPGHPGYYATKKGNIFTHKQANQHSSNWEKVIAYNRKGYLTVWVYDEQGNRHRRKVSRLVALAWVPNPNNYPIVMHKDNDTLNNHYTNLIWGTNKMNSEQMAKEGRARNGWMSGTLKKAI